MLFLFCVGSRGHFCHLIIRKKIFDCLVHYTRKSRLPHGFWYNFSWSATITMYLLALPRSEYERSDPLSFCLLYSVLIYPPWSMLRAQKADTRMAHTQWHCIVLSVKKLLPSVIALDTHLYWVTLLTFIKWLPVFMHGSRAELGSFVKYLGSQKQVFFIPPFSILRILP